MESGEQGGGEVREVGSGLTMEGYEDSIDRILDGMGNHCVFSTRVM